MKTYKYIILALAMLLSLNAEAGTLSKEQQTLRLEIYKQLKADGYEPELDTDGDIQFKIDKTKYYIIINEDWSEPYMYTLYLGFPYDDTDFTAENMEACISIVNQHKMVKLFCSDNGYSFRADVLCQDATIFKPTFEATLKNMQLANHEVREIIDSGLGGLDLTGDKDAIYIYKQRHTILSMNTTRLLGSSITSPRRVTLMRIVPSALCTSLDSEFLRMKI